MNGMSLYQFIEFYGGDMLDPETLPKRRGVGGRGWHNGKAGGKDRSGLYSFSMSISYIYLIAFTILFLVCTIELRRCHLT